MSFFYWRSTVTTSLSCAVSDICCDIGREWLSAECEEHGTICRINRQITPVSTVLEVELVMLLFNVHDLLLMHRYFILFLYRNRLSTHFPMIVAMINIINDDDDSSCIAVQVYIVTQKVDDFYFYDNYGKCGSIFIKFSLLNSKRIFEGSRN